MIDPKQIPDAVVEAAARAMCRAEYGDELVWDAWISHAQAAMAAALNAWPSGAVCHYTIADMEGWEVVLPLPEAERIAKQEESDND